MTIIHWRHLPFSRPKAALVLAVLTVEAIGAIGGIFTTQSVDTWYQTLTRPAIAPPGWVFAPVWTTLFALMGVALYRIWALAREQYAATQAVRWFLAHMVLNVGWSAAFFGLESTAAASRSSWCCGWRSGCSCGGSSASTASPGRCSSRTGCG